MAAKTKLVRDATGRLVEVAADTPDSLAPQTPPAAQNPLSPAANAAAGASPDQAKMAGTPAQKQPVLTESVAQTATVEGQARLTPAAPQTAGQAPAPAAMSAERLQALGSYGTRLQGLVNQRVQATTQQTITPQIDQAALKVLMAGRTDAELASATDALTKYLQGGRTEADLAALARTTGLERLTADQAGKLVTGGADALAAAAAAAGGAVTVGQLDLASAGIDANQLAQDLGVTPEALAAMSPDELQRQVQGVVNRQFSDTAALRAEYVSASPQRRQQIMAELRQRGESGATGVELSVADLADRMESSEQVEFGGKRYNVQQLLSDSTISDTIRLAATNEAALKDLATKEPALAAWIANNKASLETLAHDINQQVLQLGRTQEEYGKVTAALTPELQAALGIARDPNAGPITSGELAALTAKLDADPLYQEFKANPDLAALLQSKPDAAKLLQGKSREYIKQAVAFDKAARQDPDLMAILGLDSNAALLLPDANTTRVKGLLDAMPPASKAAPAFRVALEKGLIDGDILAEYSGNPRLLEDPALGALLADGTVDTKAELRLIAQKPQILATIAEHRAMQATLTRAAGPEGSGKELRTLLFGGGEPLELAKRMQAGIEKSLPQAFWDYHYDGKGDKPANYDALLAQYKSKVAPYDTNADGYLSEADFSDEGVRKIAARLKSPLTANDILAGKSDSTFDVFTNTARALAGAGKAVVDKAAAQAQANKDQTASLLAAGWQVDPVTGTLKPPAVAAPTNTKEQQAAVDDVNARGRKAEAQARVTKAQAALEAAEANYKAVYRSVKDMKGSINEAEGQAKLAEAQGRVDQARVNLAAAKRDL